MAKDIPFEAMLNPSEHGYDICAHCNGYGSSLQDPIGTDRCAVCDGTGLVEQANAEARSHRP
jgi:DnaJ-class molecular chaperone